MKKYNLIALLLCIGFVLSGISVRGETTGGPIISEIKYADSVDMFSDLGDSVYGVIRLQHDSPVPINVYIKEESDASWHFIRTSDPVIDGHTIELSVDENVKHAWVRISSDYSQLISEMDSMTNMPFNVISEPGTAEFDQQVLIAGYEYADSGDGLVLESTTRYNDAIMPTDATANNHASATPDPGRAKVFFENSSTKMAAVWILSDTGVLKSYQNVTDDPISDGWEVACSGDINNDGYDDLILLNYSDRRVSYWMLTPDGKIESYGRVTTNNLSAGWTIAGSGDLNGDGTADLILENYSDRRVSYWMLNNDGTLASYGQVTTNNLTAGWHVMEVTDINGDNTPDLILENYNDRRVSYWMLNNDGTLASYGRVTTNNLTAGWHVAGSGKINGDNVPDLILENAIDRRVSYWMLNSDGTLASYGRVTENTLSSGVTVAGVIDINNDGVDDIVIHNQISGTVSYWFLNSSGELASYGKCSTELSPASPWLIAATGE